MTSLTLLLVLHMAPEESIVDEKSRDLKRKDEFIVEKEKLLKENLDKVASLRDEVSSLQVILLSCINMS